MAQLSKKHKKIIGGVVAVILLIAVAAGAIFGIMAILLSRNDDSIVAINDNLQERVIDLPTDVNKYVTLNASASSLYVGNDYLLYDTQTKKVEVLSLNEAIKKYGVDVQMNMPEGAIAGHWIVDIGSGKLCQAARKLRTVSSLTDISAAYALFPDSVKTAAENYINSTAFVTAQSGTVVAAVKNGKVEQGVAAQVQNVLFCDGAKKISEKTFTVNGENISCVSALYLPDTVTSVERAALKNILLLKTVGSRSEDLRSALRSEYEFALTDKIAEAFGFVANGLTYTYAVRIFNAFDKAVFLRGLTPDDDTSVIRNMRFHAGDLTEENEVTVYSGVVSKQNGKEVKYDGEPITSDIDFYPDLSEPTKQTVSFYTVDADMYFPTLDEAFAAGNTVKPLVNLNVTDELTIEQGKTLLLPCSVEDNVGRIDGTTESSRRLADDGYRYLTLTVGAGATLKIEGTLLVGGTISYPGQSYSGHTSGAHSAVVNNGKIEVSGILDVWGYVNGDGAVEAVAGAKIYEPFVVTDYVGGSDSSALYFGGQTPFMRYAAPNIRCDTKIEYGATLIGHFNLYAQSRYNTTDQVVIGNAQSGGLILLSEGGYVVSSYDQEKAISDLSGASAVEKAEGNNIAGDIGKKMIEIHGDTKTGSLTLLGMANTADVIFPLPYYYDFKLCDGTFTIENRYAILPGCTVTVDESATLSVSDNSALYVCDAFYQAATMSGKIYPSAQLLKDNGFAASGMLIINGALEVGANAKMGGTVGSEKIGATVKIDASADLSGVFEMGGVATYSANAARYVLPLRLNIGNCFVELKVGCTYRCASVGESLELRSVSVTALAVTQDEIYDVVVGSMRYSWINCEVSVSTPISGVWVQS